MINHDTDDGHVVMSVTVADDMTSTMLEFVKDAIMFINVKHDGYKQRLQDDLSKLIK